MDIDESLKSFLLKPIDITPVPDYKPPSQETLDRIMAMKALDPAPITEDMKPKLVEYLGEKVATDYIDYYNKQLERSKTK